MNRDSIVPEMIGTTGRGVFGEAWRARMASGLGISRMTLWSLMRGEAKRSAEDIDGRLVALIERERDAASMRGVALTQLKNKIIAMAAKAKRESRDAA